MEKRVLYKDGEPKDVDRNTYTLVENGAIYDAGTTYYKIENGKYVVDDSVTDQDSLDVVIGTIYIRA